MPKQQQQPQANGPSSATDPPSAAAAGTGQLPGGAGTGQPAAEAAGSQQAEQPQQPQQNGEQPQQGKQLGSSAEQQGAEQLAGQQQEPPPSPQQGPYQQGEGDGSGGQQQPRIPEDEAVKAERLWQQYLERDDSPISDLFGGQLQVGTLRCAELCWAVLRCAALCCAVLGCAALCCVAPVVRCGMSPAALHLLRWVGGSGGGQYVRCELSHHQPIRQQLAAAVMLAHPNVPPSSPPLAELGDVPQVRRALHDVRAVLGPQASFAAFVLSPNTPLLKHVGLSRTLAHARLLVCARTASTALRIPTTRCPPEPLCLQPAAVQGGPRRRLLLAGAEGLPLVHPRLPHRLHSGRAAGGALMCGWG